VPKRLPKLQIVRHRDPQTQALNEKIARLAAVNPWGDVYAAFALAAHLATEAIEAAAVLQHQHGAEDFAPTLEFWHRLRDYAGTAALNCAGGNQTLAEALVTLQFLQNAAGGQ